MKIGFALITEDPFFGELIRRENALGEAAGFLDKLGPIHRLPHTTLFQGMMREDIPFESIAMELAENYLYFCPDRRVTFGDIVYVPEGWYFLEAEKDDRLQHIHDLLLERLGPYMVLDSRRLDRDTSFMSQAEKAGIEKVTAMIEVRVTPQRGMGFDKVAAHIYNYPEVQSVYLISGGFDLMVTLEGKTLREVSGFVTDKLSTIDSVLSTKTNFILKKYKDHGTIMVKGHEKDDRLKVSL